jgi:leader peptidase (prepilin peptidase)/N-methyltransferase
MLNELLITSPTLCVLFFALLALLVGSLLNVIIYRLPLMLNETWTTQCKTLLQLPQTSPTKKINLFMPRSFCTSCKTMIPAWHNIPLLSYMLLKGRCASCQHPISSRYPLVELLSVLLSLIAWYDFGFSYKLIFALCFIWISICLFFIDKEHQLLPDSLTLGLLWLGLIANTQQWFAPLSQAVLSAASAYLVLWSIIQLFYKLTGKIGMGNGDFKLFAAFGAWLGWPLLPLILLVASCLGAIFGIIYLKVTHQPKHTPIPFGPFLCFAGILALLKGQAILKWYLS